MAPFVGDNPALSIVNNASPLKDDDRTNDRAIETHVFAGSPPDKTGTRCCSGQGHLDVTFPGSYLNTSTGIVDHTLHTIPRNSMGSDPIVSFQSFTSLSEASTLSDGGRRGLAGSAIIADRSSISSIPRPPRPINPTRTALEGRCFRNAFTQFQLSGDVLVSAWCDEGCVDDQVLPAPSLEVPSLQAAFPTVTKEAADASVSLASAASVRVQEQPPRGCAPVLSGCNAPRRDTGLPEQRCPALGDVFGPRPNPVIMNPALGGKWPVDEQKARQVGKNAGVRHPPELKHPEIEALETELRRQREQHLDERLNSLERLAQGIAAAVDEDAGDDIAVWRPGGRDFTQVFVSRPLGEFYIDKVKVARREAHLENMAHHSADYKFIDWLAGRHPQRAVARERLSRSRWLDEMGVPQPTYIEL